MYITKGFLLGFAILIKVYTGSAQTPESFTYKIIDQTPPENIWIKNSADFNADGYVDLLIGGHNDHTSDLIIWYQNPGNISGAWIKHIVYQGGDAYGFEGGATGDLDGDGDLDLVMGSYWQHKLLWLENQGEKFTQWELHELGTPKSGTTYLHDFDRDGKLDIATRASQKYSGEVGQQIWIWKQNNTASWAKYSKYIGDGEFFNIGDVDMDGELDIVFANKWLRNNHDIDVGTWDEYTFTDAYTWLCTFPVVADVNMDGRNDIVLTPTVWSGEYAKTAWYEAPKKRTTEDWAEHIIENNIECVTHALGVFDFDCDGAVDVFTAEMNSGEDPDEVRIYYNQDNKGNTWKKNVIAVGGSHMNQFIDIDLDGDIDIIGGNHGGNTRPLIEMWINNTNPLPRH
jgi:hypothetical protein